MLPVHKFILFALIFGLLAFTGYRVFIFMNKKIKTSRTGWELISYALLYFFVNALFFLCGLFILVKMYTYLSS